MIESCRWELGSRVYDIFIFRGKRKFPPILGSYTDGREDAVF